jgi:hypothetical protein
MVAETFVPAKTWVSSAGSVAGIHVGSINRTAAKIQIITDEDGSMVAALSGQQIEALVRALAAAHTELK